MYKLFAYGSLLDSCIQKQLFGRTIPTNEKAQLLNWKKITGEQYPFITPAVGAWVDGFILLLTEQELQIADVWEEVPHAYQREQVEVIMEGSQQPVSVWAYTRRNG